MSTKSIKLLEQAADQAEKRRCQAIRDYESNQKYLWEIHREMASVVRDYQLRIQGYEKYVAEYANSTVAAQSDLADYQSALQSLLAYQEDSNQ